jgi:DNA-binding FadR family transcriptional regulator
MSDININVRIAQTRTLARGDAADHGDVDASSLQLSGRPSARVVAAPVRKAYEQVADRLRELIVQGEVAPGERLPSEADLAASFAVGRASVREALRALEAQNLVKTRKGAAGGSFVTLPSIAQASTLVADTVEMLTASNRVTLEELLETRELLEVPAARLAALRRGEHDLARLQACVEPDQLLLPTRQQFDRNRDFHAVILDACGNKLFSIAALPVFSVLQTSLSRSSLGRQFHRGIHDQHVRLRDAIAEGDANAAGLEMEDHLRWLRPFYERAWPDLTGSPRKRRRTS